MPSPDILERAARDGKPFGFKECPACPEWIVRCVHFEGRVLALSDLARQSKPISHHAEFFDAPFVVGLGEEFYLCPCCGHFLRPLATVTRDGFPDLSAAEAEFHRREQDLLKHA